MKERIQQAIKQFKSGVQNVFWTPALSLLNLLGYRSERTSPDFTNLEEFQKLFPIPLDEFAEVPHLLFQLTWEDLFNTSGGSTRIDNTRLESYLFFAIRLKQSHYSRTTLANITRDLNRFANQPVMVIFTYGEFLTLSMINRRLLQRDEACDVLEKVTLIKDISVTNPHRAHLEMLFNLSYDQLKNRTKIDSFMALHDAWQRVLDTSWLNKQFYQELAELFTQLVGGTRGNGKLMIRKAGLLKLPGVIDENVRKEFAVRLLGRLLFCWFLQKKTSAAGLSLVPETILSVQAVTTTREIDFYHTRLEPLFFETLNKPLADRQPAFQKDDWTQIPFLNGGLFKPHRQDFYEDGGNLNLIIPNEWLADLLRCFERYHFTLAENTPIEVQVAIDPEMLGHIFENLLTAINPETGETARKATGSYYTPREIVDYMVTESLKYVLHQQTSLSLEKLDQLLSYRTVEVTLSSEETQKILKALTKLTILDPACGSGAFPMGIVQKMTWLLQRVDPDCTHWLANVLTSISDSTTRQFMQEKLQGEKVWWDYTRKLGIVRECIYGVDIQPLAVEMSRWRCFLSLLVEEQVKDNEVNRGILPLPNLEFKWVCANTLRGISQLSWQRDEPAVTLLGDLRREYLNSQGLVRRELQTQFQAVQKSLLDKVLQWISKDSEVPQLATWKPFEDESCSWFDPGWMFGIEGGFEIVIGNPPYVRQEAIKFLKAELKSYRVYAGTADLYTYFYEASLNFLRMGGILTLITSNKWMRSAYGEKLRDFLLTETALLQLIDFKGKQVFDATVDTNIVLLTKGRADSAQQLLVGNELPGSTETPLVLLPQANLTKKNFKLGGMKMQALMAKIEARGVPLKEWDVRIYRGILTGHNEAFVIDTVTKDRLCEEDSKSAELLKPLLRGRDIQRYEYKWAGLWLIHSHNNPPVNIDEYPAIKKHLDNYYSQLAKRTDKGKTPYHLRNCAYWRDFEKEKVIYPIITTSFDFAYEKGAFFINDKVFMMSGNSLKYLVAFFNSKLFKAVFKDDFPTLGAEGRELRKVFFDKVSVLQLSSTEEQPFISLVDQVLTSKERGEDTCEWERRIDELVYGLYDLTEKEIAVIGGN